MSEINDIFIKIDATESNSESRSLLIAYLKDQLARIASSEQDAVESAYSITGLLGTNYGGSILTDDPLDEIFTIAGELESHPASSNKLSTELIEKISAL